MKNMKTSLLTASLFTLLCNASALAATVEVKNNTDKNVTRVECYSEYSTAPDSLVMENLAAKSTAQVSDQRFPENLCNRVVFHLKDGEVWQFYVEHEAGSLDSMSLELNPLHRNAEKTIPQLTCLGSGEIYQETAGTPFNVVWQFLAGGTPVKGWQEWTTPGVDFMTYKDNFLALGNLSWNLTGKGVEIENGVPVALHVVSPVAPSSIMGVIEELSQADFALQKYNFSGKEYMPQGEGKEALIKAFENIDGSTVFTYELLRKQSNLRATLSFSPDGTVQLSMVKK